MRSEPGTGAAAASAPGSTGAADARPSARRAALVLAVLLGVQPVTTDLMLPAMPLLGRQLGASMAAVQLTMSAMILAFGVAQLVWGPLADRWGRRPVLLGGLGLYVLAAAGAALATSAIQVVAWRALQGAALAVPVVCARASLRDLYAPAEGALVMARAMSGLGLIAICSPPVAGVLVSVFGWRASLWAMAAAGAGAWALIAWHWPETRQAANPGAAASPPLATQAGRILRHPVFLTWTALVTCSYGGLFVFLSGSGHVLIRVLGIPPAQAGLVMSTSSLAYIAGTLVCRRWLLRHGLVGSVLRGSGFTLAAAVLLGLQAWSDARSVWSVMAPVWLYALGHGVHQPCAQAGSVGPFPHAAGAASALAGFVLAAGAFGTGLWLGTALDDTTRALALGMSLAAACALGVIWGAVRRLREPWHG
ncbi:MAG: Bcr/CflA family efflux MFS transporter [Aquabacterium sp.]|nr:Bcr/CflA family efflux MFS transporter [Aquabacterium sp.]